MEISPSDIDVKIDETYRHDVTLMSNSNGQSYLKSILEEDPFISGALQSCPYKTPLIQIRVRTQLAANARNRGHSLFGLILFGILLLLFLTGLLTILSGKN